MKQLSEAAKIVLASQIRTNVSNFSTRPDIFPGLDPKFKAVLQEKQTELARELWDHAEQLDPCGMVCPV